MNTPVDEHQTRCPRCSAPFSYELSVNRGIGGGFRYDVSCAPCGESYFEMCAPLTYLPIAA